MREIYRYFARYVICKIHGRMRDMKVIGSKNIRL